MSDSEFMLELSQMMDAKFSAFSKTMDAKFSAFSKTMDTRFAAIDDRFEAIENRLEWIDRKFEEIDSRLAKVDVRLTEIDHRLGDMDTRFDVVENKILNIELTLENDVSRRLSGIESVYLDTYRKYSGSADDIETMKIDIEIIKKVVTSHSEKLQSLA